MSALNQGEEDEVQADEEYTNQEIKAAYNVQLKDQLRWDDLPRTGTEIDLDEGEENEIAEKEYTFDDIKSTFDQTNVQLNANNQNNRVLILAQQRVRLR